MVKIQLIIVFVVIWLLSLWWSHRIIRHTSTSISMGVALKLGLSLFLWLVLIGESIEWAWPRVVAWWWRLWHPVQHSDAVDAGEPQDIRIGNARDD